MMKLVIVTVAVFLVATTLTHGKDEEAGCVFENGDRVNVGEDYYKQKGCMRVTCVGPGQLRGVGCGVSQPAQGTVCDTQEDKDKPWPDCCPRYVNCRPAA